jgi:hypothetical protein
MGIIILELDDSTGSGMAIIGCFITGRAGSARSYCESSGIEKRLKSFDVRAGKTDSK